MKLISETNYRPKSSAREMSFADPVCITLSIEGRRIKPAITPIENRPLTPQEIRFAIRLVDFAVRVLP